MTHIEPFEPRCLMTNTGLDDAFGVAGAISFPKGYRLRNTLGADNSIYVDLYHPADNTRWLFKYDNRGHLETQFGEGGRVALNFESPGTDVSKMAVDGYYGDFYVAAVTLYQGQQDLDIQRFRTNGRRDKTFSAKDVILPGGPGTTGEIGVLEPVVHRQLLVGTNVTETSSSGGDSMGTHSVRVTRLLSSGRADPAFSGDGTATIIEGHFAFTNGNTDIAVDEPKITQLVGWTDDSYRVVDTRHTYHYQLSSGLYQGKNPTLLSGTDLQSADSVVVNTDGSIAAGTENNLHLPLVRTKIDPAAGRSFFSPRLWVPLAAQVDYPDSVWVIGGRDSGHGQVIKPVHLSVSATHRDIQPYDLGDARTSLLADLIGGLFLRADDVVTKLDFFWVRDKHFGRRGRITIDSDLTMAAVDSDGALLAASDNGRMLYRFDGTL
ncbi:MAG: hypothetical protein JWM57_777 [Phycisphaerales bacterium]|nr:hypothetical protein [Phycisphaerales bacterium]